MSLHLCNENWIERIRFHQFVLSDPEAAFIKYQASTFPVHPLNI